MTSTYKRQIRYDVSVSQKGTLTTITFKHQRTISILLLISEMKTHTIQSDPDPYIAQGSESAENDTHHTERAKK